MSFRGRLLERELKEIQRSDAAGKHEASGEGATVVRIHAVEEAGRDRVVLLGPRPVVLRDYEASASGGSPSGLVGPDSREPLGGADADLGVLISGEIAPHERHGDEVTLDESSRERLRYESWIMEATMKVKLP